MNLILTLLLLAPVPSFAEDSGAIIKSLGRLKHREALPPLHNLFESRDFALAREAVLACAKIREKSSIPLMIKVLFQAELDPEAMKEQSERKRVLHGPLVDTLKGLTKERYNTAKDWDRWRKKFGGSFKPGR